MGANRENASIASLFTQHQNMPRNVTTLAAIEETVDRLSQQTGLSSHVLKAMNEVLRGSDQSTAKHGNVPALKK